MSDPILIKKYSNRRLYDTSQSRYVTLDEVADKIASGAEVRIADANSGKDLTQATLTQIIIDSRGVGRMLPVSLLTQIIRLSDDALAGFFGSYMAVALDFYIQARRGASSLVMHNPFVTSEATAGLWDRAFDATQRGGPGLATATGPRAVPVPARPETEPESSGDPGELAQLRRDVEALKRAVRDQTRQAETPGKKPAKKPGKKKSGKKAPGDKRGRGRGRRDQGS